MNRSLLIPWLLFFSFFSTYLKGQNCGCYGCNIPIPPNSTDTIEFEFTDVINNDLSNPTQGVCGIEISFRHNRIRGLEISLISPSGQEIRLVGTNLPNPTIQTTLNTLWNILFVKSGDPANPDPGIPATWTNATNWVNGGRYTGNYYPNSGSLENFNIGPVNGTWRLVIRNFNTFSNYSGVLIDFRIILCDPNGIECCFANAGQPQTLSINNACEGDTTLLVNTNVIYSSIPPDTMEYGYTWLIAQNQIILEIDSTPDLTGYPAGSYQVCGFSYQRIHQDSIPVPGGILRVDTLRNQLNVFTPPFCGDVANRCIEVNISAPPPPVLLRDTICFGDIYTVGDSTYTSAGNYTIPVRLPTGCDSIVELDLRVLTPDTVFINATICTGETYTIGADDFDQSGIYISALPGSGICDSIIKLDLEVLPPLDSNFTATICAGDTLFIGTNAVTNPGNYTFIIPSINGCDSTVNAEVFVLNPAVEIPLPDTINCSFPEISLSANSLNPNQGSLSYLWFTPNGNFSSGNTGQNVFVNQRGTYVVWLTERLNMVECSARDTVEVFDNLATPTVFANPNDTINCREASVVLRTNAGSTNPNTSLTYAWSRFNNPLINQIADSLIVNQNGDYHAIVTDLNNGCRDSVLIRVTADTLRPIAAASGGGQLNCIQVRDTLSAVGSSAGAEFIYNWTGPRFVCCAATDAPVIDRAGWYVLTVLNNRNGCTAKDSTEVTQDLGAPFADAGARDTLNCRDSILTLSGNGSVGADFEYEWTTGAGNILTGANTLSPSINRTGWYFLTVRNNQNLCEARDSVFIFENKTFPTADAGADSTITCQNPSVTIGGMNTSTGVNITHQWFLFSNAINNATQPTLLTSQNGLFYLEVTNQLNFCKTRDSVQVAIDTLAPSADAGAHLTLTCLILEDSLRGSHSIVPGVSYGYNWSSISGCFTSPVNNLIVGVNCAGIYTLTVENEQNGCISSDSVEVSSDAVLPVVSAGNPDTLNCINTELLLNGSAQPSPPLSGIRWTTSTGNILDGDTTLNPRINTPGVYILTVTDLSNNCAASDTVNIEQFIDQPLSDAGLDAEINCDTSLVVLGGANSSSGTHIRYQWKWWDGNIISGENSLTYTTSVDGQYVFEVTDLRSKCVATDTVFVELDTISPLADAGTGFQLDCSNTQDNLDGSGSSRGAIFSYQWSANPGFIVTGHTTLNPLVNAAGNYYLAVTNEDNHCSATDSVTVTQDGNLPIAEVVDMVWLPCGTLQATLDGAGSSVGINYVYEWSTPDGHLLSDSTTLNPVVDAPGTYILEVIDTTNDCRVSAQVTVLDTISPVAAVAGNYSLDCIDLVNGIYMNTTGTSRGPELTYQWITSGGNFLSRTDSVSVRINAPGIYNLLVTNTLNNCADEIDVSVSLSPLIPSANAGSDTNVPCGEDTFLIDGSLSSSGGDILYQWTTLTGNILSGENTNSILVDTGGYYYLEVTNQSSNCTSVDSVFIFFEPCAPSVILVSPDTVNCLRTSVRLDASQSNLFNSRFSWQAISGSILADSTTLFPLVTEGTYRFTLFDTTTTLASNAVVVVPIDTISPHADAGPPGVLTCRDTTILLDGTGSDIGFEFAYEWSSPDQHSIQNPNTLRPRIGHGGDYKLLVTNSLNGCVDSAFVSVSYDTIAPYVDPGEDFGFPCDTPFVELDGIRSAGPNLSYRWSTGDTTLTPRITQPGLYCLTVTNRINGCKSSDCLNVIPDQNAPAIEAGDTLYLTCKNSFVMFEPVLPPANLDIYWTTPDGCFLGDSTLANAGTACTGTYILVVRDNSNRCISIDSLIVSENYTPPTADAGDIQYLTCKDTVAHLSGANSSAGTNYTYHWTGTGIISAPGAPDISVNATGVFQLTVRDTFNGCLAIDTVSVLTDTLRPVANAGPDLNLNCNTSDIRLDASQSAQNGPYQYYWSSARGGNLPNLDGNLNPLVSSADTFFISVTNTENGCFSMDYAIVRYDTLAPDILINTDPASEINCLRDFVSLSLQSSQQDNNLVIRWSTFTGNIVSVPIGKTVEVDEEGWYFVNVEQIDNGCAALDSVYVSSNFEKPQFVITAPNPLTCDSLTTTIFASQPANSTDYSVQWTNTAGGITSPDTLLKINVRLAGRYNVEIINNENGCRETASVIVPIDTAAPEAVAEVFAALDCFTSIVELDGSNSTQIPGLISYLWTTLNGGNIENPRSLRPKVDATGVYYLQVKNLRNGCIGIDSVKVDQNTAAISDVILHIKPPSCLNDANGLVAVDSIIGGTAPFVFSIDGNTFSTSASFGFLTTGTYTLTLQDAAGCTFDTTLTLDYGREILVNLGPDTTIQLGDSVLLEALTSISLDEIDTLTWLPDDQNFCKGCLERYVSPQVSTTYFIMVRDTNGCVGRDDILVNVVTTRPIYIPSAFSPDDSGDNDLLYIFAGHGVEKVNTFQIFDRWGDMVYEAKNFQPNDPVYGWNGEYRGKPLPSAVFVYKAEITFVDGKTEVFSGDVTLLR